jgi:hypothetical protein
VVVASALALVCLADRPATAQGLGGAGTVQGTVKDPTGGVMQAVAVRISNPVSGFSRTTTTDASGKYVFSNLPPNSYHVSVEAQGFKPFDRDVDVRSGVPIAFDIALALAGATTSVEVVGHAERSNGAHRQIDDRQLPLEVVVRANQIVTLASPGVVSDSNGFLPSDRRPRAEPVFDRQPAGRDQQSRVYSNQIRPTPSSRWKSSPASRQPSMATEQPDRSS